MIDMDVNATKFKKMISAVDSHTAGEPTRIVIGGIPNIPGRSIEEKKKYFQKKLDYIRTLLMHEPRGHSGMYGSIITQPATSGADIGVIFMNGKGYDDMCVHGSIGTVTVAIEMGILRPINEVKIDTSAGLVTARVKLRNKVVETVSIQNVPSFLYKAGVKIDVPSVGRVLIDVSFGGNFFAIVNAKDLGVEVKPENEHELIKLGLKIRDLADRKVRVLHPEKSHINSIGLVEICDEPTDSKANCRNVTVFGAGQVDRSPCGTGTCAMMAALHAKGILKIGEKFVNESIIGTSFEGRIVEEAEVGNLKAVIPEITGCAYITGIQQFVVDPRDPLKYGFTSSKHGG